MLSEAEIAELTKGHLTFYQAIKICDFINRTVPGRVAQEGKIVWRHYPDGDDWGVIVATAYSVRLRDGSGQDIKTFEQAIDYVTKVWSRDKN